MKKLNDNNFIIKLKSGLEANVNTTITQALATTGEPHYATDTEELFVYTGTKNRKIGATFSDYSLTQTGNTPTTKTKIDFNGATLVNETEDLFDATNSRIKNMPKNSVGKAIISVELDTSGGGGSTKWIEFELRAYDNTDTLLFSKRPNTITLPKGVSNDAVHQDLEFYFAGTVDYFEIWWNSSTSMSYTDPEITIIKL